MRYCLLAVLVLALPAQAAATILADWSIEDLVRRADSVVIGVVGAPRFVAAGDRRLLTETPIRVERQLLGDVGRAFVLTQLGGRAGGQETTAVGDAHLQAGERVLLITYRHTDGRRYLVGMALGALHLAGPMAEQRLAVPLLRPDGRLAPPPGRRRLRLERIEAAIRQVGR